MVFPEPVIQMSVEPKTKADSQKMDVALQKLAEEDPTFKTYTDEETGQTIIAGVGELQLDIILDRMRREFKVEATSGAPQVAYRETIKGTAEVEGRFIRQSGGHGCAEEILSSMSLLQPVGLYKEYCIKHQQYSWGNQ